MYNIDSKRQTDAHTKDERCYMGQFQKKGPGDISPRARELNLRAESVNMHDHMMFEFAIRKALGQQNVFDSYYLPELKKGGFRTFVTTVGANSPCMCNLTDHLEFGCFEQIDMLRQEEAAGAAFRICCNMTDVENAHREGKVALIMAFEGARALEGRPWEESMVMLRTFYQLGLRVNCVAGGARTVFADGVGDIRAQAGLTTFGVKLVEEMNRLGILIDLAHMTDRSFFDVMEITQQPIMVSHVGVQAVCPVDANLSDERIRAIGKNGGLIGMEIVKTEIQKGAEETGELVTYDRVVDHIDHIVDLIGPEHICLGLDFDNFELVHNVFRAMSPAPGSIEGFHTGIPAGDHMLDEPSNVGEAYVIADYLCSRGYSDEQILGILGGNARRILTQVLGA